MRKLTFLPLAALLLTSASLVSITPASASRHHHATPCAFKSVGKYCLGPGETLHSTTLPGANLTGVNLTGDELNGSNFANANLTGAILTGVNLRYVKLVGARLNGVTSGHIKGRPSNMPTGWVLTKGYFVGPGANLKGAILKNANLDGANLSGANLTGATLSGVTSGGIIGAPKALPTGWILRNGYLLGPGVNLTNDDFAGANFAGANLSGAVFTNMTLNGAHLAGANLTGIISGGISGTPATLPPNWKLVNGYLIGPGADLSSSALRNQHLGGVNLAGAQLSGADLTGVTSGGIVGKPASLPQYWTLSDGYLLGPKANLTNADLHGVDLAGADLRYATLTGVSSGAITGNPAQLPTDWTIVNGYLVGPGANLANAQLQNQTSLVLTPRQTRSPTPT